MWTSLQRVLLFAPEFGGFCHFLDYQTARGNHPDNCSIFSSRKPIVLDNIFMHLLLSCTHCDLDNFVPYPTSFVIE